MLVVPTMPSSDATGSERRVHSLLRSIDWGGAGARALSSLNLADHIYQRWGEIDFLLVGRRGLIVVEVKGGDVSCHEGKWRYEDRMGRVVTRGKAPLVQAKDAYFSLINNYVSPMMGQGFSRTVPTGFCIILAGMPRSDLGALLGSPEFPAELTGTKEDLCNPAMLQRFLTGVASYWGQKNGSAREIPDAQVSAVVSRLRPEFETICSLGLARDRFGQAMVSLTEEQYSVLDLWEGADRIFCSSAAGCGKTLLAVEMFRRSVQAGRSTILLVGSGPLADALRVRTGNPGCILSVDDLEDSTRALPGRVEVLIIDEGQQALGPNCIAAIENMVEGGIEKGRWAWFGDPNYQGRASEVNLPGLRAFQEASTLRPKLTRNCRNTPEIVSAAELASGVALGHALVSGRGMYPSYSSAEPDGGMEDAIAKQVKAWLSQDVSLESMVVLTDAPDPGDLAISTSQRGGFRTSIWSASASSGETLAFSAIDSFRGLESQFIILCFAASSIPDEDLSRMLYLGMTRANFALAVLAQPALLEKVKSRISANAAKHLKERQGG